MSLTRVWPTESAAAAAWTAAPMVTDDETVSRWLRLNDLDPPLVAARDLARAVPASGFAPLEKSTPRRDWDPETDRMMLQLHGIDGALRTLHAVGVMPGRRRMSAGTVPPPVPLRGLVLADRRARFLLARAAAVPMAGITRVTIVETAMDFLRQTTVDDGRAPAAVIGVLGGSWCRELAERIPGGARVTAIASREDGTLTAYPRIALDLASRCELSIRQQDR